MKKGNRVLIAFGVLFMICGGWYMLLDNQKTVNQEYQKALEEGRRLAKLKIYEDAETNYLTAYEMKSDTELAKEIAQLYLDMEDSGSYEEFVEAMMEKDPYQALPYEMLTSFYYEKKDYTTCVEMIEKAEKRGVSTEPIVKVKQDISKQYEELFAHYTDVTKFANGYCAVQDEEGLWGFIGEDGEGTISARYPFVSAFSKEEKLAAVRNEQGECFLINPEDKRKQADAEGRTITACKTFSEGLMAIQVDGKYTFVKEDFTGAFGAYEDAGCFSEGIAPVKEGGKWYLIKEDGSKASGAGYDEIVMDELGVSVRQERAFVKVGTTYIMVDIAGKQIGADAYEAAVPFNESGWAAVKKNGKWGFVDAKGTMKIEPTYEEARSFSNGYAAIKQNGLWGFMNEKKEMLLECQYDGAKDFTSEKSCFVKKAESWSLIRFYL